jgi:uncharacterized ferredoxin-like protein
MKLRSFLILAFWGTIALAGQPMKESEKKDTDLMNAEERMRDRNGNASVLIGTGASEEKVQDTRPQGEKTNKEFSDTDVKKKK